MIFNDREIVKRDEGHSVGLTIGTGGEPSAHRGQKRQSDGTRGVGRGKHGARPM